MAYILFDQHSRSLLPLTYARPVSHLRIGIDRIVDKWKRHLNQTPGISTAKHLREIFPNATPVEGIYINASVCPTEALVREIVGLPLGHLLASKGMPVAMHCSAVQAKEIDLAMASMKRIDLNKMAQQRSVTVEDVVFLAKPADIFAHNGDILRQDYREITQGRRTIEFPKGVNLTGQDFYVEEDVKLRSCIINTEEGPVYIARGAEVMEGALIRGPFYLGGYSILKMGAKIYGPTTVGAHCKVGGEVTNSVIDDYTNKGHDGFLGNSVIGSWCNLGADTNTSNLKNNYSAVRVWDYEAEAMTGTGRQFHGLVMGDHSKCGINTMFNTGTIAGMCTNIFGAGFPQKFIPSFSWGGAEGFIDFELEKACEVARSMMSRRKVVFTEADEHLFKAVFEMDQRWRK